MRETPKREAMFVLNDKQDNILISVQELRRLYAKIQQYESIIAMLEIRQLEVLKLNQNNKFSTEE